MIIIVVVLGAGVVWAVGSMNTGYRLDSGTLADTITTPNGHVIVSNDSAGSDYFVPSKYSKGWTSFGACLPIGSPCIPQLSCVNFAFQECGTDSCGTACGSACPSSEFCSNKHQCLPNCVKDPSIPC